MISVRMATIMRMNGTATGGITTIRRDRLPSSVVTVSV